MIPIEYLRQFRLGGYAIFDFVVVFIAIYFLSPWLSKLFRKIRVDIPKRNWLFIALPLSILTHLLVDNITPMTRDFLDPHGHYLLKAIILASLFFGLYGIKIIKKPDSESA